MDCVLVAALFAAILAYANLNHVPQVVYPPGMNPINKLESSSANNKPINPTLIAYYTNLYSDEMTALAKTPQPTCVVGKKYGALCQDGEITYDTDPAACAEHSGVKEWAECR
jgi:hypothetical protein